VIGYILIVLLIVVWSVIKELQITHEREAWTEERSQLLNRIQHPELMPVVHEERVIEAREPDEMNLVGAVVE
jgi:hypothetical protein